MGLLPSTSHPTESGEVMNVDEIHVFPLGNTVYEILVHYVGDESEIPSLPPSINRHGRVLPETTIEPTVKSAAGVKDVVWLDPDDCRRLFVITSGPWYEIYDKLLALRTGKNLGATSLKLALGH